MLESYNSVPIVRKIFLDVENTQAIISQKEFREEGVSRQRAIFVPRMKINSGKLSIAITHSDKRLSINACQSLSSICA